MSEQPGFGPFDTPMPEVGPTEFGGDNGWMQPVSKGHSPTASELNSMIVRTSGLSDIDPVTKLQQPYSE